MTDTDRIDHEEGLGSALAAAARLGADARGGEIVTIMPPAELAGLPSAVPAALYRGDNPRLSSVAEIFEPYRLHPQRKTGTAHVTTLATFIELTRRHASEHSAVFADIDWTKPSLTAVIDYHPERIHERADFCQHRVHYDFPLSDEWQAWRQANGAKMSQLEFAQFLEDRIAELATPTAEERDQLGELFATTLAVPTELVELSRGLQVNVDSRIRNAHVLASGEASIAFEETHQDASGKPLRVPGMFMLSLAPFSRGEVLRTAVRLRYRARDGVLTWFYQIYRPDQFIADAVESALQQVAQETQLPVYAGAPEART